MLLLPLVSALLNLSRYWCADGFTFYYHRLCFQVQSVGFLEKTLHKDIRILLCANCLYVATK